MEFRHESLPASAALELEWQRLEAGAPPSFFTSWHWIGSWLEALPAARRPQLLRGTIGRETVAMALLGCRTIRRRHGLVRSRGLFINETGDPLFDAMTIEHNGLLVASAHQSTAYQALVRWFAQQCAWADELTLAGSFDRFPERLVRHHGLTISEIAKPSYNVDLASLKESGGDLGAILSANARQQLRRAERHLAGSGSLQLIQAGSIAEAQAFFSAMKELHIATWKRREKRHAFSEPFFEQFHRLLIERAFPAGVVQLLRVSAGDGVIGYLYNFRFGDRVYAYQSGFSYEDARARPGAVAHAMAIREAFHSGIAVYDFLAGGNRLKQSFATSCEPMLWQTLQQPRLAFRFEQLARGLKRAAEARLRRTRNENAAAPQSQ